MENGYEKWNYHLHNKWTRRGEIEYVKMYDMTPWSMNESSESRKCFIEMHVFFLSFQESFARAKNWVKELQRQASPNIVIALAGNKADLASKRALDFQVRDVWTATDKRTLPVGFTNEMWNCL